MEPNRKVPKTERVTEELSKACQETDGDGSQANSRPGSEESSFPTQCSDDGPHQQSSHPQASGSSAASSGSQQSSSALGSEQPASGNYDKMKIWERVLKHAKVEKYLLQSIDAQDLLVYFYYMPQGWADKIRATHQRLGRYEGAKELLAYLPKLCDDENDWSETFRMALRECAHNLLVDLLDETFNALKDMPEEVVHCRPDKSMKVGTKHEDFSKDFTPAAKALLQHRKLWMKVFLENKQSIMNFIEPKDILPYLQYLPRERILAKYDNEGRYRSADELIQSLFTCTEKNWMKDFTNALRTPQVNQRLVADLLDSKFRDLLDITQTDPDYKELHEAYRKAEPCKPGERSILYYTGARNVPTTDSAGK